MRYFFVNIAAVVGLLALSTTPSLALRLELVANVVPTGTDIGLLSPSALGYDQFRDKFIIADTENNRVLLVNQQGNVLKTLGRAGELSLPVAVAVTNSGTLYVAEKNQEKLKILSAYDGLEPEEYQILDLSTYALNRPVRPVALFVADTDELYVCDSANRQLLIFNKDRSFRNAIPKVGKATDIWVKGENVYIADRGFGGVRIYNQQGQWERTLGDSTTYFPNPLRIRSIALDRLNRLWLIEESGAILALDSLGKPLFNKQMSGLFSPTDLVLDKHNSLHVLERGGNRISVFHVNEF